MLTPRESLVHILSSGTSGIVTTALFQPLVVLTTRTQHQSHMYLRVQGGKPMDFFQTTKQIPPLIRHIIKNEGFQSFYRGMSVALTRTVPGIALYFYILENLKASLLKKKKENAQLTSVENLAIAATGRGLTTVVLQPMTTIKVRLESGVYTYKNMFVAANSIVKTSGIKGLYKGQVATLLRDVPSSSLFYAIYSFMNSDECSNLYIFQSHFVNGIVASSFVTTLTHPFDVIKTNMQVSSESFKSFKHAFLKIKASGGYNEFFVGLMPRLMKRSLIVSSTWALYEKFSLLYRDCV